MILEKVQDFLIKKWNLKDIRPLEKSVFTDNYVALVYSEIYKSDVILKISLSEPIVYEQKALKYFDGSGCVKCLAYDLEHHALLLEYIQPGYKLKELFPANDHESVIITADLIKQMHTHSIPGKKLEKFPTITDWIEKLYMYTSDIIPQEMLKKACAIAKRLLETQGKMVLLHGDLHQENILKNESTWIAIDPKGVVGELEYEVGPFIRNPIPDLLDQENAHEIVNQRINKFCALFDFEKSRIIDWAFVQAALSAMWSDGDRYFVQFAHLIETIKSNL